MLVNILYILLVVVTLVVFWIGDMEGMGWRKQALPCWKPSASGQLTRTSMCSCPPAPLPSDPFRDRGQKCPGAGSPGSRVFQAPCLELVGIWTLFPSITHFPRKFFHGMAAHLKIIPFFLSVYQCKCHSVSSPAAWRDFSLYLPVTPAGTGGSRKKQPGK